MISEEQLAKLQPIKPKKKVRVDTQKPIQVEDIGAKEDKKEKLY